jgi:structural maintenance of chromosome 4
MTVLEEYRKRDAEFLSRAQDHDNVIAARDAAKARCEDLTAQRMTEFMAGFTAISTKLKEMYQVSLGLRCKKDEADEDR